MFFYQIFNESTDKQKSTYMHNDDVISNLNIEFTNTKK